MDPQRSRCSRLLGKTYLGVLVFVCASMPAAHERRDTSPTWGVAVAGGYGQPPVLAGEGATGVATGLDCVDCVTLGVESQGNYAGSVSESGPATSATVLTANGANCGPGFAPLGVDFAGGAEGCFDVATQAEFTAQVGNLGANGNQVRLTRTTAFGFGNQAVTCLPFDSEWSDVPGWHSTATNPSRITVGLAGWYLISGTAQWPTSTVTGQRYTSINYNGTVEIANQGGSTTALANVLLQNVTTLYYLNAGDYVELCVYRETDASAMSIEVLPQRSPIFTLARIGP
jgi:hypothetical protein